jgi:hypothetical protein
MSGGFGRPRAAAVKNPGKNEWRASAARSSTQLMVREEKI